MRSRSQVTHLLGFAIHTPRGEQIDVTAVVRPQLHNRPMSITCRGGGLSSVRQSWPKQLIDLCCDVFSVFAIRTECKFVTFRQSQLCPIYAMRGHSPEQQCNAGNADSKKWRQAQTVHSLSLSTTSNRKVRSSLIPMQVQFTLSDDGMCHFRLFVFFNVHPVFETDEYAFLPYQHQRSVVQARFPAAAAAPLFHYSINCSPKFIRVVASWITDER